MTEKTELKSKTAVLPPLFCAGAAYYALVRACGASAVDWGMRFDKRFKDTHRFAIADTRGRLELTVPIAKPDNWHCTWGDIRISDHGKWWDVHRVALESAYGRTPFFEFYIDPLLPMLTEGVVDRYPTLRSLSEAWDGWIRRILLLPAPVEAESVEADRMFTLLPEHATEAPQPTHWQVRADRLGFISGLSVLDLIFNLGPEAILYTDALADRLRHNP